MNYLIKNCTLSYQPLVLNLFFLFLQFQVYFQFVPLLFVLFPDLVHQRKIFRDFRKVVKKRIELLFRHLPLVQKTKASLKKIKSLGKLINYVIKIRELL